MKLYIKSRPSGTARELKSGDDLQVVDPEIAPEPKQEEPAPAPVVITKRNQRG